MSDDRREPGVVASGGGEGETLQVHGRRDVCNVCGKRLKEDEPGRLARFPCHVRAFAGEQFDVWRCETCRTIHCLQRVDLNRYYAQYPFARAVLTPPLRLFYGNLLRRFLRHGLRRESRLLDFGCGNGLFVETLRGKGYQKAEGYDPYGPADGLGDPSILDRRPYDYILLQDVLEHVEDPDALLERLDRVLAPGGRILVGTPNADRLDLRRPQDFLNEVHVPYHLHIYTRETVEAMGRRLGWRPTEFLDRSYHDLPWLGLNNLALKFYQSLCDGTQDALFDPLRIGRVLSSPRLWFYGAFGYWLSHRSDMSVMFVKEARDKKIGKGSGDQDPSES